MRLRRAWMIGAAAMMAIVIAAAGGSWWWWNSGDAPVPRADADAPWSVRTLAGSGVAGVTDGPGPRAQFSDPFGVAVARDGTIYLADGADAHRIRAVTSEGNVVTIAGGERGFADGAGASARFNTPSALAFGPDDALYVADTGNNAIRRVTSDGRVTTVAGGGAPGFRDGVGLDASFNGPIGLAVDDSGRLIVADTYNDRIRAVSRDGVVTTIAGGGDPGELDGPAEMARFDTPSGVAPGADGEILVADTGNGLVRIISADGSVRTLPDAYGDAGRPIAVVASPHGPIVADERGRLVRFADGAWRTLAGSTPGFADGPGEDARFRRIGGLAIAGDGRLIVGDAGNALVREAGPPAAIDPFMPRHPVRAPAFDVARFTLQPLLWPVAPLGGPHETAGTMGEARGQDGERFHAGIDVRVEQGTPVLAVRTGTVAGSLAADGFGSLNESIRVGPVGYVHLRVGRDRRNNVTDVDRFVPTRDERGRVSRVRVKRGARFETGDAVGSVNAFNHVHLNVGWPGEEHNPLRLRLVNFRDSVPPTIGSVRLFDDTGEPFAKRVKGRIPVSGRVRIVVDAWDQADGNEKQRRLGLYALGYQVLNPDGSPASGFALPRWTIVFNRLSSDANASRLVFAPGSGIPFYGNRATRFLYTVTNTFRDGIAREGWWRASFLEPGDYILRVRAADASGNEAIANRDVPVTVLRQ